MRLDDGQGRGYQAGVDADNRLRASAIAIPQQHRASFDTGTAYQVSGDYTVAGAGTFTLLNLTNDSDTAFLIGTYIRPQVAGLTGGTFGTATYITLNFGGAYASGGTVVEPVNMNRTSGNVAQVLAYDNNPTLTGTLEEFDRWYPEQGTDELVYNKQGTLILGKNDTLTVQLVTDNTAGSARVRLSFFTEVQEQHG